MELLCCEEMSCFCSGFLNICPIVSAALPAPSRVDQGRVSQAFDVVLTLRADWPAHLRLCPLQITESRGTPCCVTAVACGASES